MLPKKMSNHMDIVIVSDAKTDKLKAMTEKAVATSMNNNIIVCHPIIVESSDVTYKIGKTVRCDEPFNYNRYLNYGAEQGDNEYIAFCNNDLIFSKKWADKLVRKMEQQRCGSASPYCPRYHGTKKIKSSVIGYRAGVHVAGWCIVLKRKLWEQIGRLNTDYTYWCSDNIYIEQIKKHNIRHILVHESKVKHLNNQTGQTIDPKEFEKYTWEQVQKFEDKTGIKLF